jgi:hypothetical protein
LLRAWSWKHRGLIAVTLAALAVRLWWNLSFHRPTDFAFSDMAGYLDRGNAMVDRPSIVPQGLWLYAHLPAFARRLLIFPEAKGEWLALYPYGTHYLVFFVRRIFGRKNDPALGAAFAVLGALAVSYTYATAARFCTRRWARGVAGVVLVVYYPWISLGGYVLSEIPFAFCVAGAAFHGLRLADRGYGGVPHRDRLRRWDAWLLGLFLAMGATVRPQILVAAVFFAIHFVFRRRAWHGFTAGIVPRVAAPLAFVLALSAVRLHYHTNHWGLVSTNGPLNFVFGRCHNTGLEAVTQYSKGFFGPPALGALLAYERELAKEHRGKPLFTLDPVMGEKLTIQAVMGDAPANYQLAARCIAKTGLGGQLRFAITHVVLLWGYNIPWPDQGQKSWRTPMHVSSIVHNSVILFPAAAALLLAFRRRRARSMLLALHVYSLVVTAMLYFGDTRYRVPYDGLLVVLAMQTYVDLHSLGRRARERLLDYRLRRAARAPTPRPGGWGMLPVMITSVRVQNWTSFGAVQTAPLEAITVLVGANNSGKSNFLRVLRSVSDHPNDATVHRPANKPVLVARGLTVDVNAHTISYDFKGTYEQGIGLTESVEALSVDGGIVVESSFNAIPTPPQFTLSVRGQSLAAVNDPTMVRHLMPYPGVSQADRDVIRALFLPVQESRLVHLKADAIRPQNQLASGVSIQPDGAQLAALIARWTLELPERREELNAILHRCLPEMKRVHAPPAAQSGQVRLVFEQKDGERFDADPGPPSELENRAAPLVRRRPRAGHRDLAARAPRRRPHPDPGAREQPKRIEEAVLRKADPVAGDARHDGASGARKAGRTRHPPSSAELSALRRAPPPMVRPSPRSASATGRRFVMTTGYARRGCLALTESS